jgi:hypothetical protein
MKKILLFFLLSAGMLISNAQNLPLPKPQKPAPENLRVLTPPDLRVEELSLVSVVRNGAIKKINIQVLMRIKNFGELRSGPSTVLAYMKSPSGTGVTRTLPVSFPVSSINPGDSFAKVYTFQEAVGAFRPGTFDFWIKADARNVVTESNETNNTSVILTIPVPER